MADAARFLDFNPLNPQQIRQTLEEFRLNLSVEEALTIQNKFLKRPPSLAECILWSIQGSEHCSYKSTRNHLKKLNTESPDVILGAKEDAGIVAVCQDHAGHRYGVIISHESHNHPSQIVPYEGAATGVGGNVRDVCCMGGEVIAVADSLRFGDLAEGHTHWIQQGVVSGIAGYGNPLGIPNIAGDVYFDKGYNDNCLVTVVTLGVVREDHILHSYAPVNADDYVYILVGKPTDNSGFGGASFASATLREEEKESNKGAVQEPDAFLQRHILKANYALFEKFQQQGLCEKVGFKDLGAGGVACASLELAEAGGHYGAEVFLDQVHVGMKGLDPAVILCSETQERFMWVVPPNLVDTVLSHYNETFALPEVSSGARASVVGKIRSDGQFVVRYQDEVLVDAKVSDITQGIVYDRPYQAEKTSIQEPEIPETLDYNDILLKLLAHENIASRAAIIEQYDKQVQGRTLREAGEADAGVLQPFNEKKYPPEIRDTAIVLSLDQNPNVNKLDAYWGAVHAVVESVRNVVATGARPVAITDCLCFGNPEKPARMAELVDAVHGLRDACAAIPLFDKPENSLPVVAGNVSLYNETEKESIPPSPMISCLGVSDRANLIISKDIKTANLHLMLLGERQEALGASVFYQLFGELGADFPKIDLAALSNELLAVYELIQQQCIAAAHDISEGGAAVALAEMCIKHQMGCEVEIPGNTALQARLFGESGGFILAVADEQLEKTKSILNQYQQPVMMIGRTLSSSRLKMNGLIDMDIRTAAEVWERGLTERLL